MATVVVGGETYQGQEAKSKKEAEMSAAEVAYNSCLKGKLETLPRLTDTVAHKMHKYHKRKVEPRRDKKYRAIHLFILSVSRNAVS